MSKARKTKPGKLRAKDFIDVPREVYYARPDLLAQIIKHVRAGDRYDIRRDAWSLFVNGHASEQLRADAAATATALFMDRPDSYILGCLFYWREIPENAWLRTIHQDAVQQMTARCMANPGFRKTLTWNGRPQEPCVLDTTGTARDLFDRRPSRWLLATCPALIDRDAARGLLPGVRELRDRCLTGRRLTDHCPSTAVRRRVSGTSRPEDRHGP